MRPPKVPYDRLEAMLRELRAGGATYKSIARGLGYHYDHIAKLCKRLGIKQLKPSVGVAPGDHFGPNICGTVRPAQTEPAVSEAKPDDTRTSGSLTGSCPENL